MSTDSHNQVVLIKCEGCESIHPSTMPVCLTCGRCPGCGARRFKKEELNEIRRCDKCSGIFCFSCGRCHECDAVFSNQIAPCECGFPDEKSIQQVEKHFAIDPLKKTQGCLVVFAVGSLMSVVFILQIF